MAKYNDNSVMEYAKEMGEGLGMEKARKSGIEEW